MPTLPGEPALDALETLRNQLSELISKEQELYRTSPAMSAEAVFHHGRLAAFIRIRHMIGTQIVSVLKEETGV